jgi:hypothetical protein
MAEEWCAGVTTDECGVLLDEQQPEMMTKVYTKDIFEWRLERPRAKV